MKGGRQLGVASKPKRADPSAFGAARQPGSDAQKAGKEGAGGGGEGLIEGEIWAKFNVFTPSTCGWG